MDRSDNKKRKKELIAAMNTKDMKLCRIDAAIKDTENQMAFHWNRFNTTMHNIHRTEAQQHWQPHSDRMLSMWTRSRGASLKAVFEEYGQRDSVLRMMLDRTMQDSLGSLIAKQLQQSKARRDDLCGEQEELLVDITELGFDIDNLTSLIKYQKHDLRNRRKKRRRR